MSLADYKGPSNHPDLVHHLVGETIEGALLDQGKLWLILSSGVALVVSAPPPKIGEPSHVSYWVEQQEGPDGWRTRVARRREQLEHNSREIERLAAIEQLAKRGAA